MSANNQTVSDQVTGTTGNAYASTVTGKIKMAGTRFFTAVLKNTGATNTLKYKQLSYVYSGGLAITDTSEATLAPGVQATITLENKIRIETDILVASNVSASPTTWTLEYAQQ